MPDPQTEHNDGAWDALCTDAFSRAAEGLDAAADRYDKEYAGVPDEPLHDGGEWSDEWGWRGHLINARLRVDGLARSLALDGMPPFLVRQQARLLKERVDRIVELLEKGANAEVSNA